MTLNFCYSGNVLSLLDGEYLDVLEFGSLAMSLCPLEGYIQGANPGVIQCK